MFKQLYKLVLIFVAMNVISACGGGGDDPQPQNTNTNIQRNISGTVYNTAGVAATVTFVDRTGNSISTNSDTDGNYTINISNLPGPFIIKAVPNDTNLPEMYCFSTGYGVANCNLITSLAMLLAASSTLADLYSNWASLYTQIDSSALADALATFNANYEAQLTTAGLEPRTFSFLSSTFSVSINEILAALDALRPNINYTASTYEVLDSNDAPLTFNEAVDTQGYYIGAPFIPDGAAVWQYTLIYTINGVESTFGPTPVPTSSVDWNPVSFYENWGNLYSENVVETVPTQFGTLTWRVSALASDYTVTGNGEVGTVIQGTFSYSYSLTGNLNGIPVDQQYNWTYTWRWERTS